MMKPLLVATALIITGSIRITVQLDDDDIKNYAARHRRRHHGSSDQTLMSTSRQQQQQQHQQRQRQRNLVTGEQQVVTVGSWNDNENYKETEEAAELYSSSPFRPRQYSGTGTAYLHYKYSKEQDTDGYTTFPPTMAPIVQYSGWFSPTLGPSSLSSNSRVPTKYPIMETVEPTTMPTLGPTVEEEEKEKEEDEEEINEWLETNDPTKLPTLHPSKTPTDEPTAEPSKVPTLVPSHGVSFLHFVLFYSLLSLPYNLSFSHHALPSCPPHPCTTINKSRA